MATELDNIELEPARRQFLKGAAALATTLIAPGILLYQTGQASSSTAQQPRWGLLIDTNALSEADVDACVSACQREHGWKAEPNSPTDAQWIRKVKLTDPATGYQNFSADDVPALRATALCRCLPDRGLVQACGWHRTGQQAYLHRLSLLHDGLPLQGTIVYP